MTSCTSATLTHHFFAEIYDTHNQHGEKAPSPTPRPTLRWFCPGRWSVQSLSLSPSLPAYTLSPRRMTSSLRYLSAHADLPHFDSGRVKIESLRASDALTCHYLTENLFLVQTAATSAHASAKQIVTEMIQAGICHTSCDHAFVNRTLTLQRIHFGVLTRVTTRQ